MNSTSFFKAYQTALFFIGTCLFTHQLKSQCTTFGNFPPTYTAVASNFQANYLYGVSYTLNTNGYLTGLAFKGNNTGSGIQMAIYANNSGTASNLVAYTGTSTVGNGNIVLPVLTPTLIPAGVYWIMAIYQTNAAHVSQSFSGTNLKPVCYKSMSFGTTPPTTTTWYTTIATDLNYWAEINTINVSVSPSICIGTPVTLTASAANPSASSTYSWSSGSTATAITVSPSITTTYTLSTVSNSCASSKTVQVVVNPIPALSFNNSASGVCHGQSATLSVSGAQSYFWYPGPLTGPSIVVTPTAPAQYTVFGFSAFGCAGTATTNLGLNSQPTVVASNLTGTVCPGSPASLSASGATSYSWYPSVSMLTGAVVAVTPSISTTYTVLGSIGGCPASATVAVPVTAGPGMTVASTNTGICVGSSATLTANAPSSLGFTWSPAPSNNSVVVVTPSTTAVFSVTGVNSLGCRSTYTIEQIVHPIPSISLSAVSPSVCPENSVTLTADGADTYLWQQGNFTGSAVAVSPSVSTVYTVSGTSNGCTGVAYSSVTVASPATISASASPNYVCFGAAVVLSASGSSSYTWTTPSTWSFVATSDIFLFPPISGIYSVTGTGVNGCSGSATVQVNVVQSPTLIVSSSSTAVCSGGSATISVSGASTYSWLPGGSTATSMVVTPSTTSTYTISGSDSYGCVSTKTLSLTVNPTPTVNTTISPTLLCSGNSVYTLSASGANSYTWLPPSGPPVTGSSYTTFLQTPTLASYTVIGSNPSCSSTSIRNVSVNPTPTVGAVSAASSVCAGASVGLTASGAATYTWSLAGGQVVGTGSTMNTYTPGIYIASGTNSLGCSSADSVLINGTASPTITVASSSNSTCASGSVAFTASGAITYTWMPMSTSGNTIVLTPTATSNYSVIGTGTSGCTGTSTFVVNVTQLPTVQIMPSTNSVCAGESVTLTANGATNYTWLPGTLNGSATIITPSTTSTYTVIGSVNGCTADVSINIPVSPKPVLTIVASSPSVCGGQAATLTASGAASYSWSSLASGSTIAVAPTVSSDYTVIGTSSSGCIGSKTIGVQVSQGPTLTINSSGPVCAGETATLSATGAISYTWLPSGFLGNTFTTSSSAGTTYTVIGESLAGCTSSMAASLSITTSPAVSVTPSSATICSGVNALLTASGATSYTWYPGNLAGFAVTVSPLANQIYTVVGGTGACVDSKTVSIKVVSSISITAWATNTAICKGNLTKVNANGATNYTWLPGSSSGAVIFVSPNVSTTYTVTGASSSCKSTQTVQVIVNAIPTLTVTTSNSIACIGDIVVLNGHGAQTYTWNSGSTSDTTIVMPSATTSYTLRGTSQQGCSGQVVFTQKVDECLGITGIGDYDKIKVFPNPTSRLLTVHVDEGNAIIRARLLNSMGMVVMMENGIGQIELELERLANGCYYLVLEKNGIPAAVKKVIKK